MSTKNSTFDLITPLYHLQKFNAISSKKLEQKLKNQLKQKSFVTKLFCF